MDFALSWRKWMNIFDGEEGRQLIGQPA
jgi:hypothetical protein